MNRVRESAPQLRDISPYDPKYLPAEIIMSANENPLNIDEKLRKEIARAVKHVKFDRYPDPLANDLRDMIAEANGLEREQVLMGNGGDEMLFNVAMAWGGPGRKLLNMPPTFSVYAANARLIGTTVVDVLRRDDYSIDEDAVIDRLSQGDIDYMMIASPNNPTGQLAREEFMLRVLESTDALVMVDEAYFEFSRRTMRPYLAAHENLVILRTFSKAFSLAGVRLGYILGHPHVINEFIKVRQPYSVDTPSQVIGQIVYENRAQFEKGVEGIIAERERLMEGLKKLPGVKVYPSDANYILFKLEHADECWQYLLDRGILLRDFSHAPLLENGLRVTVGTADQNDDFLKQLRNFIMAR